MAAVGNVIQRWIGRCVAVIDRLSGLAADLAAWLCLALVVLAMGLVIARYTVGWTSNGLDELRWHFFGAIFLLGAAYCLREDGHVRVDILHHRLSPRARAAVEVVGTLLLLLPMCWILVRYGIAYAYDAWRIPSARAPGHWSGGDGALGIVEHWLRASVLRGEGSPNEGGLEARWMVKALIPLGFLLLALQGVAHLLRQILVLSGTTPTSPAAAVSGAAGDAPPEMP